jgi:D-3-phosphoglycerate dehydrogenase
MTSPKILIADSISPRGVEELSRDNALDVVVKTGLSEPDLIKIIPDFSGIIVRSET